MRVLENYRMCVCVVLGDKLIAPPPDPLRGNIDELRRLVDQKFEPLDAPAAVPKGGVMRRCSTKRTDVTNSTPAVD